MAPARGGAETVPSHSHCPARAHTQTFTRSGAAVVLQVGAVLPFVVFRAVTEIVHGKIEALGTVLTGVWLTIIYVQLQVVQREEREVERGGRRGGKAE